MSLKKQILAVAIVGGLFTGAAQADVYLNAQGGSEPVAIANEAIVGDGLDISNTGSLDLTVDLGYSFSDAEVRYARVECSDSMVFDDDSTVSLANAAVGQINGLGTSAIYFSITALDDGTASDLDATEEVRIDGDRIVTSQDNVSCSFGLYDNPSEAAHGGDDGLIADSSVSGDYMVFRSSYGIGVYERFTNVADVEAEPAFSLFSTDESGLAAGTEAGIGDFEVDTISDLDNGPAEDPIDPLTGDPVEWGDLIGSGSELIISGNFSMVADANGDFDPHRVRICEQVDPNGPDNLDPDFCFDADEVTAASAVFSAEDDGDLEGYLYIDAVDGTIIPVSGYTASFKPVADDPASYKLANLGPVALGNIIHNGTELQAPLAQRPNGWLSRMVLTNSGPLDRDYSIRVAGETGNDIGTDNLTGTVPAGGTIVVDLDTVLVSFTGKARATLYVNVAGPQDEIEGLYQIVNPTSGSISNHVMSRPHHDAIQNTINNTTNNNCLGFSCNF